MVNNSSRRIQDRMNEIADCSKGTQCADRMNGLPMTGIVVRIGKDDGISLLKHGVGDTFLPGNCGALALTMFSSVRCARMGDGDN